MARRSEIGNLGLPVSTATNTEITINFKHGHHSWCLWRGGFLTINKSIGVLVLLLIFIFSAIERWQMAKRATQEAWAKAKGFYEDGKSLRQITALTGIDCSNISKQANCVGGKKMFLKAHYLKKNKTR